MKRVTWMVAFAALSGCAALQSPSAGLAAADAAAAASPSRYEAVTTRDYRPTGPGNWLERNQGVAPGAPQ